MVEAVIAQWDSSRFVLPEPRDRRRFERLGARILLISLIVPLPWEPAAWGFTVFPFVLVLVPLLALWLIESAAVRSSLRRPSPWSRRLVGPVWAATFCSLFAFMSAIDNAASLRWAFLLLYCAALAAFCLFRLPKILTLDEVCHVIAFDVVVLGVLAIIQFSTRSAVGALGQYFDERTVQNSLAFLGPDETLKRAQGTFSGAVILAQWLAFGVVFLFGRYCARPSRVLLIALLIGAGGVVLTFTRSAWILTSLGCVATAWLLVVRRTLSVDRFMFMAMAGLLAVVSLLAFAPATWTGRFGGGVVSADAAARDQLSAGGIKVALDYPAFGVGYDRFLERAPLVGVHVPERPHNVFVQIAAEQGLLALGTFLALLFSFGSRFLTSRGGSRWLGVAGALVLALWIAFMFVFDIASDYALLPSIIVILCVCLGFQQRASPSLGRTPDGQTVAC